MNDYLRMILVFFVAVNPAAVLLTIGPRFDGKGYRLMAAGAGVALAAVVAVAAAVGSDAVLDALNVEPATFRTSAGIIMAAMGVLAVWRASNEYEFEASWKAGIFPVGIPLLVGPATLAAALSYADDPGVAETVIGALAVIGGTAAAIAWLPKRWDLGLNILGRFSGAVLIVFAVALVVSGVKDV